MRCSVLDPEIQHNKTTTFAAVFWENEDRNLCIFASLKLYKTAPSKTIFLLFHVRLSDTDLATLIDKLQKNADKVEKNIIETEQNLNRVSTVNAFVGYNQS